MKLNAEQEKVKNLLKDTITLLCKNGLKYKNKFNVEATIGVTVDDSDVILMSMNELIESAADKSNDDLSSDDSDDQSQLGSSTKTSKRKRRKRKMKQATSEDSVDHHDSLSWSQGQSLPKKSTYEVLGSVEDDNDVDLLEIKTEPSLSMSCEAAFGDINTDHSYLLNPNQTNNPRASSTQARPKSDQFSNESTASTSTVQGGHSQSDQVGSKVGSPVSRWIVNRPQKRSDVKHICKNPVPDGGPKSHSLDVEKSPMSTVPEDKWPRLKRCQKCQKITLWKNFKRHCIEQHAETFNVIKCPRCTYISRRTSDLDTHFRYYHKLSDEIAQRESRNQPKISMSRKDYDDHKKGYPPDCEPK